MSRLTKIRSLMTLAALALPVLALTPGVALSQRVTPSAATAAALQDADGARVIVKYKALGALMRAQRATGARGPQLATTLAQRHGLALSDGRIIEGRTQALRGARGGLSSQALATLLAQDADVEYAVVDGRKYVMAAPSDPLYAASASVSPVTGQWYLRAPDSTAVSAINAEGAWAITQGLASVVVADIDTGVLFSHPDLTNKLLAGYDFVTNTSWSGDGSGRDSDATDPGDWYSNNLCGAGTGSSSSSWHGTQTSSIIGAQTNNGVGMASVGYNTMVLPVRALGKCGGTDSDIIAAMLWAGGVSSTPTTNPTPAKVINMSLGGSGSCSAAYQDAINQLVAAGVTVVVAAGNEEGLAVATPANCSGVIAVAGVRHVGTKVGFSSIGPQVAISAPGGNCVNSSGACLYPIITATNSGTTSASTNTYSDASNYAVGTSFATPMVAGAAALMLAVNPQLTPADVKSILQSTARTFPTSSSTSSTLCHAPNNQAQDECVCTTSTCGAGMLDVAAAVRSAASTSQPTAVIVPSATTVTAGSTVTLASTGSSAASGRTIASYAWAITAGSGIAAISGASNGASVSIRTSASAGASGSFTAQLTVTDSAGVSSSTSTSITVNAPAAPAVAILASASVVAAGSSVTFDGSGSSVSSGLTVAGWQWQITSGSTLASITSGATGASATVATQGSGSGTFTIRLTVTDSLGQQSSSTSTVTVTALAPTAAVTPSASSVTAGAGVTFDGSGSTAPSGRTIASYQWTLVSGSGVAAISGSSSGSTLAVTTSAAGSFTVRLAVTDSAGASATRDTTVTVNAASSTSGSGSTGSSSGGGGGATSPWALLAMLGAAAALAAARISAARRP